MSIEAMKLMVAEMEYVLSCINEDKVPFDGDDFHEALRLGRQAIEQAQKQEPVAKVCHDLDGHIGWNPSFKELPDEGTELYTSPPQRQPEQELVACANGCSKFFRHTAPPIQPLTDKQLSIIGSRWHLNLLGTDEKAEIFAFARAIEAAHGITGEQK